MIKIDLTTGYYEAKIREELVKEESVIPDGWEEEVYFRKGRKYGYLSFSDGMTHNTWTRSDDCIGRIGSLDLDDGNEYWHVIDDDWVEVDDHAGDIPKKAKKAFEEHVCIQEFDNPSVISTDDALEYTAERAEQDGWYEDIMSKVRQIVDGKTAEVIAA